jgi:hypothetical protein
MRSPRGRVRRLAVRAAARVCRRSGDTAAAAAALIAIERVSEPVTGYVAGTRSTRSRPLSCSVAAVAATLLLASVRAAATFPVARRGQRVRVRLDSFALGGRWCTGRYTGKITELQTLFCLPGTMCPAYIRLLGAVARFTLVVHA